MEIKLLKKQYDREKLYRDFREGTTTLDADYVSEDSVNIPSDKDFPIYLAKEHNSLADFKLAIKTLKAYYIETDRDIHMSKRFWHSLCVLYKREYIIQKYPEVVESQKAFGNIVLKKFDWENYIYKCTLAAEYIEDSELKTENEVDRFIEIIYNNLDIYNYIIKYNIFRNSQFIFNFLTIVYEEGLSEKMKKKIPFKEGLGKDERYGRRVVFELNKKYPIVMAPFLDKEELKEEIENVLSLYA